MSSAIPPGVLRRYFEVVEHGCSRSEDFAWLEENLPRHPALARTRLPDGQLPLRVLLERQAPPGCFVLLAQHGAEHDLITSSAATDLPAVRRILNRDPHLVHETDSRGNAPLHWACVQLGYSTQPCDTPGLVDLLLAAGSDVNARDSFGHTPLDRHILDGDGEACETLLDHGAEPSVLYGVMTEDFQLLDRILDDAPDTVHWRDPRNGQCLLHLAVRWECRAAMLEYLLARGAETELETPSGRRAWTPLLLALQSDNPEAAEVLIARGADVNARETRVNPRAWSRSAVQSAVLRDRIGLVEMLIGRGADIHERGPEGDTLLCHAESMEIAELLLRAGIDPASRDAHGRTALDYAIEEGRRDVAATLVRHGTEPTFFYFAAVGDCRQVRAMLEADSQLVAAYNQHASVSHVSVPVQDAVEVPFGSVGGTALHYAAKSGVLAMVRLLLDRGAEVNAATEPQKWTPLHDATYFTIMRDLREGAAVIRTLVSAGAGLNAETWGGWRPLDIADYLSFEDRASDVFDLLSSLAR